MWWYDRQGAIQSHGINFVQDLPYFLVLLLCFDRFTPEDWGVIPAFNSKNKANYCTLSLPVPPLCIVDIKIDENTIRGHFGIVGRATQVLHATSESEDPRDVGKSLKDVELVIKVYWPEASRVGEKEIIDKALEIAQHNDDVNGHIPDLICSHDYTKYSTNGIRTALGIENKGHRVLRVMLFRRLYPITDLVGEEFWKAFWECFRCKCSPSHLCHMLIKNNTLAVLGHFYLWKGGVEHNDISVKNLMYDRLSDRGVLNDYDLAHLDGETRPTDTERTGTIPFMALDLLTEEAWAGHVTRQYRHDCESFAWVLLWICCRYDKGGEISNPPLNQINTLDFCECYMRKMVIVEHLIRKPSHTLIPVATPSYEPYWSTAIALLCYSVKGRQRRVFDEESEPTIDEVILAYGNELKKAKISRTLCTSGDKSESSPSVLR